MARCWQWAPEGPFAEAVRPARAFGGEVELDDAVPYGRIRSYRRDHDVLLFPSLHDSGGMVMLEAIVASLSVIRLDIGRDLTIVDGCALAFRSLPSEHVVADLADGICPLAADDGRRRRMGNAASVRAERERGWSDKRQAMTAVYRAVASGSRRTRR